MGKLNDFELKSLEDPAVRYGFDNYDALTKLGEFVRQMRKDASLSQVELQKLSGIDQGDISRIESGAFEKGPALMTLARMARATGKRLVIKLADADGVEVAGLNRLEL